MDIITPQRPEEEKPRQSSPMIPVAIILAGIIIAGSIFLVYRKPESPNSSGTGTPVVAPEKNDFADPRPVSDDDHILGNPSADIFIIEYSDLECGYCKEFHPTMHKIVDEFGKTGKVAWVYRQFPIKQLHSKAPTESEASECAAILGGNTIFWKYIDRVFEITPSGNGLDMAKLPEIASEVGLDVTAFNECLASGQTKSRVERDTNDALASGANGTPFIHIVSKNNTKTLSGVQTYLAMKIMINNMLSGQ